MPIMSMRLLRLINIGKKAFNRTNNLEMISLKSTKQKITLMNRLNLPAQPNPETEVMSRLQDKYKRVKTELSFDEWIRNNSMESYAKQKLNIHSVMQAEGSAFSVGANVWRVRGYKGEYCAPRPLYIRGIQMRYNGQAYKQCDPNR